MRETRLFWITCFIKNIDYYTNTLEYNCKIELNVKNEIKDKRSTYIDKDLKFLT